MAISIAMVAAARSDEVGGPKLAEAMAASLTNAVLVDTGDVQQIDNLNTDKLSVQTPFWAAVDKSTGEIVWFTSGSANYEVFDSVSQGFNLPRIKAVEMEIQRLGPPQREST